MLSRPRTTRESWLLGCCFSKEPKDVMLLGPCGAVIPGHTADIRASRAVPHSEYVWDHVGPYGTKSAGNKILFMPGHSTISWF